MAIGLRPIASSSGCSSIAMPACAALVPERSRLRLHDRRSGRRGFGWPLKPPFTTHWVIPAQRPGARGGRVESLLKTLRGFGIGRLAATIGVGAGVAAVLVAVLMRMGAQPESLLYSSLDLK